MKVEHYDKGFKIVSLAKNETVVEDLNQSELDFIYLNNGKLFLFPGNIQLIVNDATIGELNKWNNYDVFEIFENGKLINCYDDSSIDNYFFVSGKCNSNCIMCPTPDILRKTGENTDVEHLIEMAKHIPSDTVHLTVTGGEPFMIGESIFEFFEYLKYKFEETGFLILTNGRIFAVEKYVSRMKEVIPNDCIIGIPIHGASTEIHDSITQAPGSFNQTITGIKRLLAAGIRVELRWVACGLNIQDFVNMANLVVQELSGIEYVSIMATEMTGSAYVNKNQVWVPYREVFSSLEKAIDILVENAIDVKLYNFPLCTVKKRFWTLCEKSISPNKVRYAKVCDDCKMKSSCGGIFAGTFLLEKEELETVI